MTPAYEQLQRAQQELNRAIWAGGLQYADEGDFDDLEARDKFVTKQVGEVLKILDVYIRKTRPVQSNKRRPKPKLFT